MLLPVHEVTARGEASEPAFRAGAVVEEVIDAVFDGEAGFARAEDVATVRAIAVTHHDAVVAGSEAKMSGRASVGESFGHTPRQHASGGAGGERDVVGVEGDSGTAR